MENKKKFKLQLPHVYTLAFILIIGFAILTWILPSGQFDRQLINTAAGEREVAVAGTYHVIDKVSESGDLRQGLHEILMAPTRGIQAAADVVAFDLKKLAELDPEGTKRFMERNGIRQRDVPKQKQKKKQRLQRER